MQIYKVKNDTAYIFFHIKENIFLSDFILIEDPVSSVISQVMDISTTENNDINCAFVKFLLSVNEENKLSVYDGHVPSKNSEISSLNISDVLSWIKSDKENLLWGNYFRLPNVKVETGLEYLYENCCVIADKPEQCVFAVEKISGNLVSNDVKVLIIDFDGKYKNIENADIITYGEDFKIPLNSKSFDYIFNNDLIDCPVKSKITVQSIILELQKYADSADGKFIPFDTFMNIVIELCNAEPEDGLLLFVNKLIEYRQKKIFADNKNQFSLETENALSILDLSDIDPKYFSLILEIITSSFGCEYFMLADISENIVNECILKNIYEKNKIPFIPVIGHDDKFLNSIKSYCKNFVIFSPVLPKQYSEPFGEFIEKLSYNKFLIWGANSLFIPFMVSMLKDIDLSFSAKMKTDILYETKSDTTQTIDVEEVDNVQEVEVENIEESYYHENDVCDFVEEVEDAENLDSYDLNYGKDQQEENVDNLEEDYIEEQSVETSEDVIEDYITEDDLNDLDYINSVQDENENSNSAEFAQNEIIEPDYNIENNISEESVNNDYIEEMTEEILEYEEQELVLQDDSENIQEFEPETVEDIQLQEISENNYQYEQQAQEPEQPLPQVENTREDQQPVQYEEPIPAENLPVYEPKEVITNTVEIPEEGARIMHAKYGVGTVEKIIKYGKKTLCSIVFDTVGRRLLDPNITTITPL